MERGGAAGVAGGATRRQGRPVRRHLPGDGRQQEAQASPSQGELANTELHAIHP